MSFPCISSFPVYVSSMYISPLCIVSILFVWSPLRVVSPPCVLLRVYVFLFGCFFMCMFPRCICSSVCTSLLVRVPSICISLHAYVLFMCFSLCAYVPSYDCSWNSYSSNHRLMRSVSEVLKLTSILTSIGLLECIQWGTEAQG